MIEDNIDNEVLSKIRNLSKMLKKELPQSTLNYIEDTLGMNYDEALKKKPVDLFFLLLENYVEYLHYLVMLSQIDKIFKDIKVEAKPAFFARYDIVSVDKLLNDVKIDHILGLYEKLFIKCESKQMLSKLISMVESKALRNRLARFFLGDNYEYYQS